jgi:hypothetical protein
MLAFITSLRHPKNAAEYGRVEAYLQDTLASVANQSIDDFVVIVVGNQRPSFTLPKNTHFVEVNFPAPSDHLGPQTGAAPGLWDKGTKLGVGLLAAREFEPNYVMFFDADDFVHRGLAAFTRDHPGHHGWVLRRGWIYSRTRNAYAPRYRLFRICGTSYIVPYSAHNVPVNLPVMASQAEVAKAFGDERLERVMAGHRYALEWWRTNGIELNALPFPGAVYHVDTGENHSGMVLAGPALPYRSNLLADFGIRPSRPPMKTLWSAFGLPALKPDMRIRRPAFLPSPGRRLVHPSELS